MPLSEISPDVWSGEGALSHLDSLTKNYPNILLFVDSNGFEPCGAAAYFQTLAARPHIQSIKTVSYEGKALPIEDIETLYDDVKNHIKTQGPVDLIIGVGGGTVIDLAKVIAVAMSNQCPRAEEVLDDKTLENTIPLIFIPTTAGTGSEATSFAVVYRDKIKISIERKSVLPKAVLLDPLLLKSLPEPVLNATVMDALAQAVESVWAVGSTAESKEYSKNAIPLILDNLEKENTVERLSSLQQASFWAGKAINVSKTTLSHSISYPISAHFGVAHGIAVFLSLPQVARLNYYADETTKQDKTSLQKIAESFTLLFQLFNVDHIDAWVKKLEGVMTALKIQTRLRDYGIKETDLPMLAENALTKGRSDNNPRKMSKEEALELLRKIY